MSTPICEIQVPTYKRPGWLRDALMSIIGQEMRDWVAVVLDDSPDSAISVGGSR